jgi:hypothetical protein
LGGFQGTFFPQELLCLLDFFLQLFAVSSKFVEAADGHVTKHTCDFPCQGRFIEVVVDLLVDNLSYELVFGRRAMN